jgi:hypothetical protein
MTFKTHVDNTNTKARKRLNVIRTLTHTSYGHSKEDITTVYKQYIRPILSYAHTAWQPDLADTHVNKLQVTQNTALRIATGCTLTTPRAHLHEETRVLPLRFHWDMRGTHMYNSTVDPEHPLHYMQTPTQTRRNIRTTPATHYRNLTNHLPPTPDGLSFRRHVHTVFTQRGVDSLEANSLLHARPPELNPEERTLSRADRVHLTRFRCGHHPAIPAYRHRIGLEATDTCTWCGLAPGSTRHLLEHCAQLQQHRDRHNITTLEHLWTRPVSVGNFLRDAGVV